jgi:hypothetical protein
MYKKRLPEDHINISKHVGVLVLYEIDIIVNILRICLSK